MEPVHFYCPDCDHEHFDIPAITKRYPDIIAEKLMSVSRDRLRIGNDTCRIMYPKPRRSFVRANLSIAIIDEVQTLDYGLWVELAEESFDQYKQCERSNIPLILDGDLANAVPDFADSLGIPVQLVSRAFPLPPILQPVADDNDLWRAFEYGIEDWEAQMRLDISALAAPLPSTLHHGAA